MNNTDLHLTQAEQDGLEALMAEGWDSPEVELYREPEFRYLVAEVKFQDETLVFVFNGYTWSEYVATSKPLRNA